MLWSNVHASKKNIELNKHLFYSFQMSKSGNISIILSQNQIFTSDKQETESSTFLLEKVQKSFIVKRVN